MPDDMRCAAPDCPHGRMGRREFCRKHQERINRNGTLETLTRGPKPADRRCSVDDCGAPHKGYGLCRAHLDEARRDGRIETGRCAFADCGRPVKSVARGLCEGHDGQRRRGKELTPLRDRDDRSGTCVGPGHDPDDPSAGVILAGRLCSGHYAQKASGRDLTPLRRYQPKGGPCASTVCAREATVEGMCATHRRYYLADQATWDRPIAVKAANGAGHINAYGYRVITVNGRNRLEHRVIASEVLLAQRGTGLRRDEEVHHRNGNRADNRIDGPFHLNGRGHYVSGNLEIWSYAQPKGQEIGPKVEWALQILRRYAPANVRETP